MSAIALVGFGCSHSADELAPEDVLPNEFAGAPEWVLHGCAAFWAEEDADAGARICGVGDAAIGQSMSIARTKATSRARTEISRTLETKVKNMVKDFQEQVTDGEAEMSAEQFSTTTISLSRSTLNGTTIHKSWVSPTNQLYVLVSLDVESFENSLRDMENMSDRLRAFIEARARRSFAELDEQMEGY